MRCTYSVNFVCHVSFVKMQIHLFIAQIHIICHCSNCQYLQLNLYLVITTNLNFLFKLTSIYWVKCTLSELKNLRCM